MAAIYSIDERADTTVFEDATVAFGVFDGVHRGHRVVIDDAIHAKKRVESHAFDTIVPVRSLILTFDRDPDEVLGSQEHKKIMSDEVRIDVLRSTGVDGVAVLPFTDELSRLEPEAFLEHLFGDHLPRSIHVGSDLRFGYKAAGDVALLEKWASAHRIEISIHDLLMMDGEKVSSTRIRDALAQGDVAEAERLLGHPYVMRGRVEKGRGQGRDMGFRTANLHLSEPLRALSDGVYGGYAYVGGKRYKAAMSVGISPTFEDELSDIEDAANVEVHILGLDEDIYDEWIDIEPKQYLRPMIRFDSVDELIATVQDNITWINENL